MTDAEAASTVETVEDALRANAKQDRSVTIDGTTTSAHSLKEQIDADKYLKKTAAAGARQLPIKVFRATPEGAV